MPRTWVKRPSVDRPALLEVARLTPAAEAPDFADAACRGKAEVMFPEPGASAAEARELCADCPELVACREWGLSQPSWVSGVWGGLTKVDRDEVRAARRRATRRVAA